MITVIIDLSRLDEILFGPELFFFYLFNALFILVGFLGFQKDNQKIYFVSWDILSKAFK